MKIFLYVVSLFYVSTAVAVDDSTMAEKIADIALQSVSKEEGANTVVVTRQIPEASAKEHITAVIIDEEANPITKNSPEFKVEKGTEHDPIQYPKMQANVFTLDFSNPQISLAEVLDGGVVVDEIPTLVNPLVIPIEEAEKYTFYNDDEYVAMVEINGDARAYPLRVLNWHQGVNDEVGGQPMFVAYDPLSGNIMAIDRRVAGEKETTFGVTGQVYKSASLYYDRATKSIWSPFDNMAVTGVLSGEKMKQYKSVVTTWASFKENYPQGVVLDMFNTGYDRNYRQNPYGNYAKNSQILFPVPVVNEALPRKEYVIGVRVFKGSRRFEVAMPINALLKQGSGEFEFMFDEVQVLGSKQIPISFKLEKPYGMVEVTSSDPDVIIEKYNSFWFTWVAHNPNTRLLAGL